MKEHQKSESKKLKLFKKRSGYGPLAAILVTFGIYFGAQLLTALFIGSIADIRGVDGELASELLEDSVAMQFTYIFLFGALSIYFLWLFLGRRSLKWSDIGVKNPKLVNFAYAIPLYLAYFLLAIIALQLVQALIPSIDVDQDQLIGFENATGAMELALVFASLVVIPALVEEILIRGFLYGGLIKKYSKILSALIASFIFAVAHLQFGSGEKLLWIAAIDTFILSMVLIWLREKTGNIWAGVVVHMIKNSIAFVSLFILRLG